MQNRETFGVQGVFEAYNRVGNKHVRLHLSTEWQIDPHQLGRASSVDQPGPVGIVFEAI